MKRALPLLALTLIIHGCNAQQDRDEQIRDRAVGGPCEGCEALYEHGDRSLRPHDTLPDFLSGGPQLKLKGTIYKADGYTPAEGIILYAYHTDTTGHYPKRGDETGWGRRHGYLRGWVRTGKDGRYTFLTTQPAAYPDLAEPAHIHLTVKEPGLVPYYIDDMVFEDDPILNTAYLKRQPERGGNGVVSLHREQGMLVAERDIILGRNIPGYSGE